MPKYIIEREIPDSGKLSQAELKDISQKSNGVLSGIGNGIQWQHSYVTDNKIYCVYIAPDKGLVTEHAKKCEIPANSINEIVTIIDPATAE